MKIRRPPLPHVLVSLPFCPVQLLFHHKIVMNSHVKTLYMIKSALQEHFEQGYCRNTSEK